MNKQEFIIRSMLDLDFYKLTMAQVAWKYFRDVPVKYAFTNRTKGILLANVVDEEALRKEMEHIKGLKFTLEEIQYLKESKYIPKGLFSEEFLDFLGALQLSEYTVIQESGNYRIEVGGKWPEAILWETLILSVVNELYYRALIVKNLPKNKFIRGFILQRTLNKIRREGEKRLAQKIETLKEYPEIKFTDFGTRRRFGHDWHKYVIQALIERIPGQLSGTSNVLLAKEFGLRPIGTFAHEMYMVFSGVYHDSDEEIRASHNKVIQIWWEQYGEPLSIALTDNYGSDFFFRDFTAEQAKSWRAIRQDSGDPIEFGEKAIRFYQQIGIDPKTKTIVFSDGLDLETILKLHKHFQGRIQTTFGWGTNLTNDLGFKALSLVVKISESCGYKTVKLSDNIAKALGSPEDVERFKKIFGYSVTLNKPCTY